MQAEINVYGPNSILSGEYPLDQIREATSWRVAGSEYSKAYKRGLWDGRKNLFNSKTGSFPTGLLSAVKRVLGESKVEYAIIDHRVDPVSQQTTPDFTLQGGISFTGKYAFQEAACIKMVQEKQGIVRIATNGGKSCIAAAVAKYLNIKTLFVVPTRELLYQVRTRFSQYLGIPLEEIGIIGDNNWAPGDWITVAILDTLESRMDKAECQSFLKSIELLFIDECHGTGSETWYTVATLCPAYYRFGLSGTPLDRTDGANLRLIAATGDVIVDIGNKFLVDSGVSARANIVFDKITEPVIKKNVRYNAVYKAGVVENPQLNAKIIEWTKVCVQEGLSVLILLEEISHGKSLDEKLWTDTGSMFIPHQFIFGEETTEVRVNALREFEERKLPVLIASSILDEGVDVPTIDVLICAGSRKSRIRTLQRLGRGLRGTQLIVIEFSNFCHDYLLRHSLTRFRDYRNEECFPMYNSAPSASLIKQLWKNEV
jgi:superfamily II DNA or RNA helicase